MLKALWRSWFGPKVKRGQRWIFDDFFENNPFRKGMFAWIQVIEVRRQWVLFRYEHSSTTDSTKVGLFRFCYKLSAE